MRIPTQALMTDLRKTPIQRAMFIVAALFIAPIVHADYDFNNPAYTVHNTPDTSTAAGAAQARADAAAARQQSYNDAYDRRQAEIRDNIEHQAELNRINAEQTSADRMSQPDTYTPPQQMINDQSSNQVDYAQLMRANHRRYAAYRPGAGAGYAFILFGLLSVFGWMVDKRKAQGNADLYAPEPQRGRQIAAAIAGTDLPIAMRKAEASPSATAVSAAPASAPHDADKPIEFIRPVFGAAAEAAAPVAPPAPKTAPPSGTTLWAQTQLDLFAKDQSPEPILYASQVKKIDLDYSAASLERLDVFLQQLKLKTNPQLKDYSERFQYRNLLILLGLYIGTTVARLTHQQIKWYDYAGAKTLLDRKGYSDSIQCAYSCMLGRTDHYMPIELVCEILFGDNPDQSCVASLAYHQQRAMPMA